MRRAHRASTTGSACRTVGRHPGAFADVQAFVAAQSRRRPRTVRGCDRDDAPAPLTVGQQAAQEAPELVERGAVDRPGGTVGIDAEHEQQLRPVDVAEGRDHSLVEQDLTDARTTPAQRRERGLRVVTQRVRSQPRTQPSLRVGVHQLARGRPRELQLRVRVDSTSRVPAVGVRGSEPYWRNRPNKTEGCAATGRAQRIRRWPRTGRTGACRGPPRRGRGRRRPAPHRS